MQYHHCRCLPPHLPCSSHPTLSCWCRCVAGYGFAEYADAHTAQSAIRNLNNYDLNGRSLRVDLADDDKPGGGGARRAPAAAPLSNTSAAPSRFTLGSQQPSEQPTSLPFTPATVLSILSTLSSSQRVDLLLEVKRLSSSNPEACRLLLMENPALAHLLLQCQLAFGLVKPEEIEALVRGGTASPLEQTASATATLQPAAHTQQPIALSMPLPPPPPPQPQPPPPAIPAYPAPPHTAYYPQPLPTMPLPPPPPPPAAVAYPSADDILSRLPPLPAQQREILVELLRLTPDELRGLPMEAQQQVKDILQKMGIGR